MRRLYASSSYIQHNILLIKLELLLDSLFNGVAIGSVLLVAALGLAIVFGLMGVINLRMVN